MCKRRSKRDTTHKKTERGNRSQNHIGDTRAGTTKEIRCREDTAGEGGERKRQPDVGVLQRQIQELLDEKQQTLEKDEKTRQELANYQTMIGRMREEIQGLRRTVAGSGFSMAGLRNVMDAKKRANEELQHRNHSLGKELRRTGQRWLDQGV